LILFFLNTLLKCVKEWKQFLVNNYISEKGVVIRPYIDRCARDNTKLRLKLINPKYKESGDEIS
jgi:hypothetical protein